MTSVDKLDRVALNGRVGEARHDATLYVDVRWDDTGSVSRVRVTDLVPFED